MALDLTKTNPTGTFKILPGIYLQTIKSISKDGMLICIPKKLLVSWSMTVLPVPEKSTFSSGL